MTIDKLRYSLTDHRERHLITASGSYENYKLLIHPSQKKYNDLISRLMDDLELMPKIEPSCNNGEDVEIKFYEYDYKEAIYEKSELLAFTYAYINPEWNIAKGIDLLTGRFHFWLESGETVYDPSLAIITSKEKYCSAKRFKKLKTINNQDIREYLRKNNNLRKFYSHDSFRLCNKGIDPDFSIDFVNEVLDEFNENVQKQYELDEKRIEKIKQHFNRQSFAEFRQVLSRKRKSFLETDKIAVHPDVNENILIDIGRVAKAASELLKDEYNLSMSYYKRTMGNCYALSIMFNLFDERFKLVQGGIPYKKQNGERSTGKYYQHSWLEKDGIVYDPALRIVTPKELYYLFVEKQDEYTKEETEAILKRIGFNLTHFRDFMQGVQVGNEERIRYRGLVRKIDSPEFKAEGEKLIEEVKVKQKKM